MVDATLLVNFWYAHPVGHAIEALRYCLGYHTADPTSRISLVLNAATPTELAALCPFVETTYPVSHPFLTADHYPAEPLAGVPSEWDWIVDDSRRVLADQRAVFGGFAHYYDTSDRALRARNGRGVAGAAPPAYKPHQRLTLTLPPDTRASAAALLAGAPVRIAVLPAGSSPRELYPSVASWELVLRALVAQHPDAVVCLVGKLGQDERTSTSFRPAEMDRLRRAVPHTVDVVDRPIVDQLAAVEACDVLISPHSGFGMAALAVGTPWLTLGGNRWPEYFFNGVPFHSVLPDRDRFPCYTGMSPEPPMVENDDGEGLRSPSMCAARVRTDLPELLDAAGALIEGRVSYEDAMADHFARLLRFHDGDRRQIWSIDNVHLQYLG